MTELDWLHTDHFSISEAWGDPYKMNLGFVRELSRFREFVKIPIIITCGTQGRHEDDSLHSQGIAVDCVIPKDNLLDSFFNACRFQFTGIGFYPEWEYQGLRVGGLHLEQDPKQLIRKFWMGVGTNHADTQYYGLSLSNLEEFYLPK